MIKCPECRKEHELLADDLPDGTYTETCTNTKCTAIFSYVMEDGVAKEWKPPKNVHIVVKDE
jgi:hypothetical protein